MSATNTVPSAEPHAMNLPFGLKLKVSLTWDPSKPNLSKASDLSKERSIHSSPSPLICEEQLKIEESETIRDFSAQKAENKNSGVAHLRVSETVHVRLCALTELDFENLKFAIELFLAAVTQEFLTLPVAVPTRLIASLFQFTDLFPQRMKVWIVQRNSFGLLGVAKAKGQWQHVQCLVNPAQLAEITD